jgi:hypothetical protein
MVGKGAKKMNDGPSVKKTTLSADRSRTAQFVHPTERTGDRHQAIPHDSDFHETLKIADELMDEYKDTLAALAAVTRNG